MLEWRPCPGFAAYEVSESGDVRRISGATGGPVPIGTPLKGGRHQFGYRNFILRSDCGRVRTALAHRLVCEAFHGAPGAEKREAAHCDGDPLNNHYTNLRWASRRENEADKRLHGTMPKGETHRFAKLTLSQVEQIRHDPRPTRFLVSDYGVCRTTIQAIRSGKKWRTA